MDKVTHCLIPINLGLYFFSSSAPVWPDMFTEKNVLCHWLINNPIFSLCYEENCFDLLFFWKSLQLWLKTSKNLAAIFKTVFLQVVKFLSIWSHWSARFSFVWRIEILILERKCLSCSCKYFGQKNLVKSLLISTLDKVIYYIGTFLQGSTKPLFTAQNRVETSWKKIRPFFFNMRVLDLDFYSLASESSWSDCL
jgi:hypothetical protein